MDLFRYIRRTRSHETRPHERLPGTGLTIIAVLGEERDRSVVSDFCWHYDWGVFFVPTCEGALNLLADLKPQVILMDRDSAGPNWRPAMSALASASGGACIMLVSKVVDDGLWIEVVLNGGYEVLPKPVRREEICRAVRLAWSYWNSAANSRKVARK
jgi:DNA-binding response OmpR family regulator